MAMPMSNEAFISFGCKDMDSILDGGIPRSEITNIYSVPDLGKSWVVLQTAHHVCLPPKKGGLEAIPIIIDTEQYYSPRVMSKAAKIFGERWGVDPEYFNIEVIQAPDIYKLFSIMGMSLEKTTSMPTKTTKGGKVEIKIYYKNAEIKDGKQKVRLHFMEASDLWRKVQELKSPFVAIDSLSSPVKPIIPSGSQNFPARDTIMTHLLQFIKSIAWKFNLGFLITNHISKSQQNPRDKGRPYGGGFLKYTVKNVILMRRGLINQREVYGQQVRRLERIRQPMEMPGKEVLVILEKDKGFVDLESYRK